MSKFRLTNNVPDVYVNQSRDFQLLLRLYDSIFSGTKLDIDSMQGLINTSKTRNSILPLFSTKVGFFTNLEINDDKLRILLGGFPSLIRNKGSLLAIKEALNLYLKTEHIKCNIIISYSNVETTMGNEKVLDHTLSIGSDKTLKNPQILQEIFKYILPIGFRYRFYSFKSLETEITELENNEDIIILSKIVNNPYAQIRGDKVDYSQENLVDGIHVPSIGTNPDYTDPTDPDNTKVIAAQNELLGAVGIMEVASREDAGPKPYLSINGNVEFTLHTTDNGKYWNGIVEYSIDKTHWQSWDGSSISSGLNKSIYLRGRNNSTFHINYSQESDTSWVFSGQNLLISIEGNIENLLDWQTVQEGNHPTMSSHCFKHLFAGATQLVNPPELPATQLSGYCYDGMFSGCTSLIKAPELPATQLENYCYYQMFSGCKSLITAPELPATQLKEYCYFGMFARCSALTVAPELPATQLALDCYSSMFYYCESLVSSPELPATQLEAYCYYEMFAYCSALSEPSELPATQLAVGCYHEMYRACTSLVKLPRLPATSLYRDCYRAMFYLCSAIKISETQTGEYVNEYRIPSSGTATTTESNWTTYMFSSTGGTFTGDPQLDTTYYTSNDVI